MNRAYLLAGCLLTLVGCALPPGVRRAQLLENEGRLTEAIDLYRQELPQLGASAQRGEVENCLARALAAAADQALAHAESALGRGEALDQYDRAIAVLEARTGYDDAQKRVTRRLSRYRRRREELAAKRKLLIDAAGRQADEAQWGLAIRGLQEALHIRGDAQILERKQLLIRQRDEYYKRVIEEACEANDWQKALAMFQRLRGEDPRPDDSLLAPLEGRVNSTKQVVVRQEAETLRNRYKYFTAYTTIVDAGIADAEDLLDAICREGSRYYLQVGKEKLNRGKRFHAYIAAVKAKVLDPDNDEIFKFHRDREDEVDASIRVQIGIAGFDSPASAPDAGPEFSDALISHLTHSRPYGIDIMEQAKTDEALKEERRHLDQAVEILGTHLIIVGNVSTLTVDKQQSDREIAKRMKVGTDAIPNPKYDEFCRRYGVKTEDWPYLPPQMIERDRFELITYRQGEARMEGVMTVSVRIFTTNRGAITQADTFTVEDTAHDQFRGGVPEAGISDDPLELPTELSMKQELQRKAVKEVAAWVLKNFDCRQGRYLSIAMNHLNRRECDEAIKALAQGYLYCLREGLPQNEEWARQIRQLVLYELTEPA